MRRLIFLLLFVSQAAIGGSGASDIGISLQIVASNPFGDRPSLTATLTNTTRDQITVDEAFLPWGNRYAITLMALPVGASSDGQPLQLVFPIADPMPGEVVIKPRASISGEIHLDYFFKDIRPALMKKGPVMILWTYQLKATDGRLSNRVTGYILMKSPGSN